MTNGTIKPRASRTIWSLLSAAVVAGVGCSRAASSGQFTAADSGPHTVADAGAPVADGAAPLVGDSAADGPTPSDAGFVFDAAPSDAAAESAPHDSSVDPDADNEAGSDAGAESGACAPGACAGDCTSNAGCAAPTPTCGFAVPNVCGGCTSDAQCPVGTICDSVSGDPNAGTCVAPTLGCSGTTVTDVACALNPSDECCAGSCVPGNCCFPSANVARFCGANAVCTPQIAGESTGGGICTTCAAVSGASPTYYVDPVHGDDGAGTGNITSSASCAFKTITRALDVVGSAAPGTAVTVIGPASVKGSVTATSGKELFPIRLPSNVTLTTIGGAVTVYVPAATASTSTGGFVLSGNPSAISGAAGAPLTIDGQSSATWGVYVTSPAATLSAVKIQGFASRGIIVTDAATGPASALSISGGVVSSSNGADGMYVTGSSTATIDGAAAPTSFENNGAHGVLVDTTASIQVNGAVGASPPTSGTVVMSGNKLAGIWIAQTPGATAQNVLTGVVCTTSSGGDGLRIVAGSSVLVRDGWFLGNPMGSGIEVTGTSTSGAEIAAIDLGTASSPGGNVVQAPAGQSGNGLGGICLSIPATAGKVLSAQGNVFGGTGSAAVSCATQTSALHVSTAHACTGNADIGGSIVAFPADGGAHNVIDVAGCSYP